MTGRCIHCLGRVEPPAEVCEACLDLLSDLGEDVVEPPPQPAREPAPVNHTGRFEPTQADIQAYEELSQRGAFRPFDQVRAKEPPGHTRGRWGRAVEAEKRRPPRLTQEGHDVPNNVVAPESQTK